MPEKTTYERFMELMGELSGEVATLEMISRVAMDDCEDTMLVEALLALNHRMKALYLKLENVFE